MLCHVFWSQVEYKIVCFIFENLDESSNEEIDPYEEAPLVVTTIYGRSAGSSKLTFT